MERRHGDEQADAPGTGRGARRAAAALATAALLLAPAARAACPGDPPALAEIPAQARIAFLRERLEAARGPAERWSIGWGVANGAFTVGQLVAVPIAHGWGSRAVLLAGAASSALGVVQIVFLPVRVPRLPPPEAGAAPCATLAALEGALERAARNQALGSGMAAHAGNLLINAGLGIGTALAEGSWWSGALAFAIGAAIGEAQIRTLPTSLVRARESYLAGALAAASPPAPRLGPGRGAAGVVSLELRF